MRWSPPSYVPYQQYPVAVVYWRAMLRTVGYLALGGSRTYVPRACGQYRASLFTKSRAWSRFSLEERSGVEASAHTLSPAMLSSLSFFEPLVESTGLFHISSASGTKEIGVRIALGAATSDILQITLGHAVRVAGVVFLYPNPSHVHADATAVEYALQCRYCEMDNVFRRHGSACPCRYARLVPAGQAGCRDRSSDCLAERVSNLFVE